MSNKLTLIQGGTDLSTIEPALEAAKQYVASSVPKNTQRAYASDWADFAGWCADHSVSPMPADPRVLAAYLAELAKTLKASTIRRRLAAIAKAHSTKGHPNPCSVDLVKAAMKGIEASIGARPAGKSPVTHDHLSKMVAGLGNSAEDMRAHALLLVGFAGAFRRSELCDLRQRDLAWSPEGVVILLRRSKTDQRGEGQQKAIPFLPTDNPMCAARALVRWLRLVPQSPDYPVFPSFTATGAVSTKALSAQSVALIVKGAATRAGLNPAIFSGHSLRAGHVTEARARGVADSATMQTTGHKRVETLEMYDRRNNPFSKGSAADVLRPKG